MTFSELFTRNELIAWGLIWGLFLSISVQQGGAGIGDTRTPDTNSTSFCQAYVSREFER